jgi:hypothetical protein
MATITADTFLDGGTARTAGEAWTINGGRLTVRSDTRWHVNAPASMTGTLGSLTISSSLGGGVTLDGTKVRWLAFTGGSGNVPAIGTTISQGGVSGYLLGVWASVTVAPTAAAAAMPASGFLKLREVTGGTFASGALTGITATASGADVVGWIEVVMDQAAAVTVPRLGDFTVRSAWFDLGTTTGAANQLVQLPTNGSSTGYVPGVWVDDASITITGATWAAGVLTITAPNHGLRTVGRGLQTRTVFIEGVVPSAMNVSGVVATIVDVNTITIPMVSAPGSYVSGGAVIGNTFYPAVYAAAFITTNFGTDIRSTFVNMETTGAVRIGHNGTGAVGYVPPSGRKIRVPNVLMRQCTTGARATNAIPNATLATRPDFTTTNAGIINIDGCLSDWYMAFAQAYSVKMDNTGTFDAVSLSEVIAPLSIVGGGIGVSQALANNSLTISSCFAGGDVADYRAERMNATNNAHGVAVTNSYGLDFTRSFLGILTYARLTGATASFSMCEDIGVYDGFIHNQGITFATSKNCFVVGNDYCDRYVGTTNTTTAVTIVSTTGFSENIVVEGITFGRGGTIANVHPYGPILQCTQSKRVKLRNCGTRSAMLNGGTVNSPSYIYVSGGNNIGIKVQRCYMQPTRTGALSLTNSDQSCVYEHVYGTLAQNLSPASLDTIIRNIGATYTTTGQAAVYGQHWLDYFITDTTGQIVLAMNEPTTLTAPYVTKVAGTPKYTSAGNLVLASVGDEVIWETPYWIKGITGLGNVVPVVTGTNVTYSANARWGNHDLYFQIDTGSGWNGSWINFTQANIATYTTIDPAVGVKFKFRAVCATANTGNLLTYVKFSTVSTINAQGNLYPLDVATVRVSGLVTGTRVKATKVSDGAVLYNGAESAGVAAFETDYIGAVQVEARKASAAPYYQPWVTQVTTVAEATTGAIALQTLDQ